MSEFRQQKSAFDLNQLDTPMKCPHCTGRAHLIRMAPAGAGQEQRTFECETCKQQTVTMVQT